MILQNRGKKKLEYKIYSLYCWSKLLYSHFSLKSAFVSQRPWYLPLYLPFYHSYWKHGNYGEILKLQASFRLHGRDMDAVLTPFLSLRLPLGGVEFTCNWRSELGWGSAERAVGKSGRLALENRDHHKNHSWKWATELEKNSRDVKSGLRTV